MNIIPKFSTLKVYIFLPVKFNILEIKGLKDYLEAKKSEKKMSVKAFYEFMGLTKGTYYNIINDEKVVDAQHLVNMIKLFGQDFKQLIGIVENGYVSEPSIGYGLPEKTEKDILLEILEENKKQTILLQNLDKD